MFIYGYHAGYRLASHEVLIRICCLTAGCTDYDGPACTTYCNVAGEEGEIYTDPESCPWTYSCLCPKGTCNYNVII